jgi:uncharacterized protein YciI
MSTRAAITNHRTTAGTSRTRSLEGVVVVAGAVGHVESAFIVVRVADEAAARDLAEHDVYWTSGAWARIRVRPYGLVRLSEA